MRLCKAIPYYSISFCLPRIKRGTEASGNSPCRFLVFASPDHLLASDAFTAVPPCDLIQALHAQSRPVHCELAWRQPIVSAGRLRLFSTSWRASVVDSTSRGLQVGCNSPHIYLLLLTMADPLTVVGAVASVVQLIHFTTKVLTRLDEYRVKAGELPSAFAHIASQLPLLRQILEKTQEGIKLQVISQEDVEIIEPCLQGCQQQMQKLDTLWLTILPEAQERTARRVAKGFRSLW